MKYAVFQIRVQRAADTGVICTEYIFREKLVIEKLLPVAALAVLLPGIKFKVQQIGIKGDGSLYS
jgi:hypothetical protein